MAHSGKWSRRIKNDLTYKFSYKKKQIYSKKLRRVKYQKLIFVLI